MMHEDVFAVFAAQKSETLCVIEPLDCALFHLSVAPLLLNYRERNVEVCEQAVTGTGKNFRSNSTIG
jgi:hypothetical protein